jgi:hypothetical protein
MIRGTKLTWLLATAALGLAYSGPAYAQATRTWVSGTGDDANPCSRTAPCKTFAGAISKTAQGGEINCIDAAGYGTLTILHSITIDCRNTEASPLASGTNGFVINAASTDVIVIRGLDFEGLGPSALSLNGIKILSAAAVHVEDCVIRGFGSTNGTDGNGIFLNPSATTELYVERTVITDNGNNGILVKPQAGATGTGVAMVSAVTARNNAMAGFKIDTTGTTSATGVKASLDLSDFSGGQLGVGTVVPVGTQSAQIMLTRSTVIGNNAGVAANGGIIRVSDSTITSNGTGIVTANSGQVKSYGDNRLDGNTNPGVFTAPNLTKS